MKITVLILFALCVVLTVDAQIGRGGKPYSILSNNPSVFIGQEYRLPAVDNDAELRESDRISQECRNCGVHYGRELPMVVDIKGGGRVVPVKGGRIWVVTIKSANAKAMQLLFERYKLPAKASLYIYNEDKSTMLGAFSHINNHPQGHFATEAIPGNAITIEYFEADQNEFRGELQLSSVVHVYRDLSEKNSDSGRVEDLGDALSCEKDVACTSVAPTPDAMKKSVCRISMPTGDSFSPWKWCTGSLINNSRLGSRKPYVLTAFHCWNGAGVPTWKWIFQFDLQNTTCSNNNPIGASVRHTVTGATIAAGASSLDGTSAADYILLDLGLTQIESDLDVAYAGWHRKTVMTNGTRIGIHHPMGDAKKMASHVGVPETASTVEVNSNIFIDNQGPINTWKLNWTLGLTEPGSSGSPLFEGDKVVGTLKGGISNCSTSGPDWYSQFGYEWDKKDYPFDGLDSYTLGELVTDDPTFTMSMNSYVPPPPANLPPGTSDPDLHSWAITCRTYTGGVGASPTAVKLGDFQNETPGACVNLTWKRHGGVVQGACIRTAADPNNKAVGMTVRHDQAAMSRPYNFVQGKEYVLSFKLRHLSGIVSVYLEKTPPATGTCDLGLGTYIYPGGPNRQLIFARWADANPSGSAYKTWAVNFVADYSYSHISVVYNDTGYPEPTLVVDDILLYEDQSFINNNYFDNIISTGLLNGLPELIVANSSVTIEKSTKSIFVHPWVMSGRSTFIKARSIILKAGFEAASGSTARIVAGPAIWIRPWDQPFGPLEDPNNSALARTAVSEDRVDEYEPTVLFNYEDQANLYRSDLVEASLNTIPIKKEFVPAIIVSPNPTKGKIFGEFVTKDHVTSYTLTDTYGREMLKGVAERYFELDLSSYSDGIYIVRATLMGKDYATKVLLKR
jgi:hypothetical protein